MLNRQRTLLSLISAAGSDASHIVVTKWAFLLKMELPSLGGAAFYEFLPYKYGPFSFSLFQEAAALVRNGLLHETGHNWSLTAEGRREAVASDDVERDIYAIARRHQNHRNKLIDYVYSRYPWYTLNSEIKKCVARPLAKKAVYTAGYAGLPIEKFLNGLLQQGIFCVLDVRNNPVSRKYGYHKSTLSRFCSNVGLAYQHFPTLGIASALRRDLSLPGARSSLFADYSRTTLASENDAVEAVGRQMAMSPSVLVCQEASAVECHRFSLAHVIAEQQSMPIHHLRLGE